MIIRIEPSVGFVVKIHVSYDVSVIYHEERNSKPSVKVNLRDGYQISIKLRDELYSSARASQNSDQREVIVLSERGFQKF